MDILDKRNIMAHTYDEKKFNLAINKIKDEYYEVITQVYKFLGEKI